MKLFTLTLWLLAMQPCVIIAQKPGEPCCGIVMIDKESNLVTVLNNQTGQLMQYKTAAASITGLKKGDKIDLNNLKSPVVNGRKFQPFEPVNGFEPVNEFSFQTDGGAPCCEIVSLQVNDATPCCELVTTKDINTGQTYHFLATSSIARSFTIGQKVQLNANYAVMKSGATASPSQKGWYAFKIMDSVRKDSKKTIGNETEKWIIGPGGKGATGSVTVALSPGTTWYLLFTTTDNKDLIRVNDSKSHSIAPGTYNIIVSSVPVLGVPVQKGMITRLKVGTLNVISDGQWGLYDHSKTTNYVSYFSPGKIGIPVGKYQISMNGQFQEVEIKDGEVTDF